MADISICCLLYNSQNTLAGRLDDFFKHLENIESAAGIKAEKIIRVDSKTSDNTFNIAKQYSNPKLFTFEDFSSARNLLLDNAKSEWVVIVEPDMRYDINNVASIIKSRKDFKKYKSIEAYQYVHKPNEPLINNLYYLLMRPTLRFHGFIFETTKVYPEETLIVPIKIGDHFMREQSERMQGYKELCDKEIRELKKRIKFKDHQELYWGAMRYSELGLNDCLSNEEMDKGVVSLLQKAISIKPDFGSAYFELAKQHLHMNRIKEALAVANKGYKVSYYKGCLDFIEQIG